MKPKNSVFIATSIDGFIADKNGNIDFLNSIPNPDQQDMGFVEFTSKIDALVMGRTTFETVCGFGGIWPYQQHVYVLSNTLTEVPDDFKDKASVVNGPILQVVEKIHQNGHLRLYIDGGSTIQSFLKEDLIDELIISTIPIILGGGHPLFSELNTPLNFEFIETKTFLNQITQTKYQRKK